MTAYRTDPRPAFPAVITAATPASLQHWLAAHGPVDELLHTHGAILFRGFAVHDLEAFDAAVTALIRERGTFLEESSPRTRLSDSTFTSTDFPGRYAIQFHSEYSYADTWPARLVFGCLVAPGSGGATLIADTRRVLVRLPEEQRLDFVRHGIRYNRNYLPGFGVPWSVAFGTEDRVEVEQVCSQRGIQWRWSDTGLHTIQHGAAVVRHPVTDERCWFNHALILNVHGLEPASLRDTLLELEDDLRPSSTSLGDGRELDAGTIDLIRQAYAEEAVAIDWHRGDVLVIDNMIAAHGRAPYTGERRIVVSMGDPVHRAALPPVDP